MTIQPLLGPNGNLPILIRDDDTNFFTNPKMLDAIYSEAWNEGFKVSLSVIPRQRGIDDLCVPPNERNSGLNYSITDNVTLIKYLKEKVLQGQVEILQHGFEHTFENQRGEFFKPLEQANSIIQGRNVIQEAFGEQPKFFVPPGEDISYENLKLIEQLGLTPICRNTFFDRFMRFRMVPNLIKKISFKLIMGIYSHIFLKNTILSLMKPVVISPEPGFIKWSFPNSKFRNLGTSERVLELSRDIIKYSCINRTPLCILNHYHSYFYDWNSDITKTDLFRTWIEVIRSFRDVKFGWKTDFINLYARFLKVDKVKIIQTGSKISIKSEQEISDYSFLCSSPIEKNALSYYDNETKICTIKRIVPESKITIYLE